MSQVVCITGMHRSGTSLTASWLQKCGVQIDNGELVGASIGNLKGHFEDKEFVKLHSSIVLNALPKSKGWIVDSTKEMKITNDFDFKANEIIKSRIDKYDIWGWKDPRTVLFVNAWYNLIPNLKFVFVWRDAVEVVNSLINRKNKSKHPTDQISRYKAYKTWCYYNMLILDFYKKYPDKCLVFHINSVKSDNHKIYNIIKEKFKLNLVYQDIEEILESSMFSDYKPNILDKGVCKILNITKLEEELKSISLK